MARERAEGKPTQAEVAAAVGVTQSYFHRVEAAQEQPSPAVAERIATFFRPWLTEEMVLYPQRFMASAEPLRQAVTASG